MKITKLLKEMPMPDNNSIIPDVYIEFENSDWLTVEVIKTSSPRREVHEHCGSQMIVLDLNELGFIDDDRAFSKWIQNGGVAELLRENASSDVRQRRFDERETEWKRKDEREFRAAVQTKISECQQRFGFQYTGDEAQVSRIEDIDEWFEAEKARKELRKSIQDAIDANVARFGETLDRGVDEFSSPEEVNKFYQKHFKERIEREHAEKLAAKKLLDANIEAAKKALEKELDIEIREHFETMADFNEYAQYKRREEKMERLNEELAPLIRDLEAECSIKVRTRFLSREEFNRYAIEMRARHLFTSIKKRNMDEYRQLHDDEVMKFIDEYQSYLENEHPKLSYKKKWEEMERFLRKTTDQYLEWSFTCAIWPAEGDDFRHKLKRGPYATDVEQCVIIDQTCGIEGEHRCNHHESELAKDLIQRIKADMYDPNMGMKTAEQRRFGTPQQESKSPRKTSRGLTSRELRKMRSRGAKKAVPSLQQEKDKVEKIQQTATLPEQPSRPSRKERFEMSRKYIEQNKGKAPQIDSNIEQEDEDEVVELRRKSEQMKKTARDILERNSTDTVSEDGGQGESKDENEVP